MIEYKKCLKLFESGFSLVTVQNNKKPNFKWQKEQSKPMDLDEFKRRYEYKGGYFYEDSSGNKVELPATENVGIITGYDYLEVIDVDLKVFSTAKEQKEWWKEYLSLLEDNILDFHDKFKICKTRSNGYHILYKSKRVQKNTKIAKLKGHSEAIIETRGVGGYVFIYNRFLNDEYYDKIQFISDLDREILWSCSKMYDYIKPVKEVIKPSIKKEYGTGLTPWDDFNDQNRVIDIINSDFTIVRDQKDKIIVKRHGAESPHSGYIYKDNDLLYLFSTGTQYPNEKALSAFACYAWRDFNGDFKEASKKAYQDGYGERVVVKEHEPKEEIVIDKSALEFPIEIFPKPIQNYLLECNRTLDSPIDFMGCSLIWVISLSIGNAMQIEVKRGWREIATVWIAIVGKAGIGKTPSINNVIFPLEKINNREIAKYITKYAEYEKYEAMSQNEKKEYPEAEKPSKTQFLANDITFEALVALHQENENAVGVFKDELAGWFKDMNKYKQGSDLEFWLSCWSGKAVNLNRLTRAGSFVAKPLIPVLGGIQPAIFNTFYTEENKDNGFLDRMLLSYPDLQVDKYNDNEMTAEIIQWYSDSIISFFEKIKKQIIQKNEDGKIEPIILKFDSEAKVEWVRIFNEITETQNSDLENEYMKSMLPKQKSYIPRFAMLIHAFNCVYDPKMQLTKVSKESILKAEKLSKYFVSMAKKVKIDSIEAKDIRDLIKETKGVSNFDKFKSVYKKKPDFNKKEVSEQLGVSLRMIYKYIKQIDDAKV